MLSGKQGRVWLEATCDSPDRLGSAQFFKRPALDRVLSVDMLRSIVCTRGRHYSLFIPAIKPITCGLLPRLRHPITLLSSDLCTTSIKDSIQERTSNRSPCSPTWVWHALPNIFNSGPWLADIAVDDRQVGSGLHSCPYAGPEPVPLRNWTRCAAAGLGPAVAAEGSKGWAGPLRSGLELTEAGTSADPALGSVWPRLSGESWHTAGGG